MKNTHIIGMSTGLAIVGAGLTSTQASALSCALGRTSTYDTDICLDVASYANGSYISRVAVTPSKTRLSDRSRITGRPVQFYLTMRRDSDGWVAHTWSGTTTTGKTAVICSQYYEGDQLKGSFNTPCHKWPDSGYSLWVTGTVDGINSYSDGYRGIWK